MAMELGLSPDTKAAFSVPALAEAARDAGFTALGLEAARAERDAATTLSRAGLRCHEVIALLIGADEEAAMVDAKRLADAASEVGAPWVLTVFVAPFSASLTRRCAAAFAGAGVKMAVEFSRLSHVPSIPEALAVVDAAGGADRAGVVIDSWNLLHAGGGWEGLMTIPLDLIAYVQFADALDPLTDKMMSETLNRRALPGEGVLDLRRFAGTLRDRGWDGLVSAEVLNHELRQRPVREFTRRSYDAAARYWLD